MAGTIRRVVTGHDATGASVIVSDAPAPAVHAIPNRPGYAVTQLWNTDAVPAPIDDGADPTGRPLKLAPPDGGIVLRLVEFPPDAPGGDAGGSFSAEAATAGGAAPHPHMHRTRTVDYAIILDGEIHLILDRDEVLVRAGDVVVQRGTSHAWSNRSGAPCRVAFMMIDGAVDPALAERLGAG